MSRASLPLLLLTLAFPSFVSGNGLAIVKDVDPDSLAANIRQVVAALDSLNQPLPQAVRLRLDAALALPDRAARPEAIQAALDPECLLGVTIERDKAPSLTLGPARTVLEQHGWRTFLVKVHNPTGSTASFPLRSLDRRIDVADAPVALLPTTLSGHRLEYRLIRISARELGRREATMSLDLGSRGDLAIAFTSNPHRSIVPDVREPANSNALADAEAEADRLDPLGPTLTKDRAMEGFAGGRFPRVHARNYYTTPLPDIQEARNLIRVLNVDALALAERRQPDASLASCRAILGVVRAVGDEPITISQLVRMAAESIATQAIERTLAQGEPSDEALARTQALLADEAFQPLHLYAFRGDRAGIDDLIGKIATGEIDVKELSGDDPALPPGGGKNIALYRESQAYGLLMATRLVEIAKRPMHVQSAMFARLDADLRPPKNRGVLGTLLMTRRALPLLLLPGLRAVGDSYLRTRALLRCSELAIALERTRRANGRWPRPGESLAPALPDGPPPDPYTGKPLRWKATETGLVVYSVGNDLKADGGNLNNNKPMIPGTDIGYRLWDVSRRAQEYRP